MTKNPKIKKKIYLQISSEKCNNFFRFENQIIAPMKREVVLGTNMSSLKLHLDELSVIIDTLLAKKPNINLLTEIWICENVDLDQYDLQGSQPNISFARTECKRHSGGVAFYFESSWKKTLKNDKKLECSLFEVLAA